LVILYSCWLAHQVTHVDRWRGDRSGSRSNYVIIVIKVVKTKISVDRLLNSGIIHLTT